METRVKIRRAIKINEQLFPRALEYRCRQCGRRLQLPRWELDTRYIIKCECGSEDKVVVLGDASGVITQ